MSELDEKADSDSQIVTQVAKEKLEANSEELKQSVTEATAQQRTGAYDDLNVSVKDFVERLLSSWFGSTHPPSAERVQYMRDHLPLAVEVYEKSIAINGRPIGFQIPQEHPEPQQEQPLISVYLGNSFFRWLANLFGRTGDSSQAAV